MYTTKLSFINEEEVKTFPGKQKPREYTTARHDLQKIGNGMLKTERKNFNEKEVQSICTS
jgi:hypothetical protein